MLSFQLFAMPASHDDALDKFLLQSIDALAEKYYFLEKIKLLVTGR